MQRAGGSFLLSVLIAGILIFAFSGNNVSADNVNEIEKAQLPQVDQEVIDRLYQRVYTNGFAKVIVGFQMPVGLSSAIPGNNAHEGIRADAIQARGNSVLAGISPADHSVNHKYEWLPFLALSVNDNALTYLLNNPNIISIEEDVPQELPDDGLLASPGSSSRWTADWVYDDYGNMLTASTSQIGADAAWSLGYDGTGWVVAVLDTGIRETHEFFGSPAGKVVSEACYSADAHCPNGLTSDTSNGSAVHYPNTYNGWDHGTHVAGIATGQGGTWFKGVAPNAKLIAINVFSKFATGCTVNPCVMTYTSDQVAGLNRVYALRSTYNIASVNMSIGGSTKYNDQTICDNAGPSRKTAIQQLRNAGIAVVIAAGNNGWTDGISMPACLSPATAIGSVDKSDVRSSFSNYHALMEFWAPGSSIYSSTGDRTNTYESWNGTSMATPQAAGAWALLKQASNTTVGAIETAIASTGFMGVTGSAVTKPRIQVDAAAINLNSAVPTAPTGEDFESGSIPASWGSLWQTTNLQQNGGVYSARSNTNQTDSQNSYMTTTVSTGAGTFSFWYRVSSEANFDLFKFYLDGVLTIDTSGVVGWTQYSTTLSSGTHTFRWVYAKDSSLSSLEDAAYVDDIVFPGLPATPTTISPTGTIAVGAPTFTWTAVTNGDQYELVVWTAGNAQVHRAWYTAAAAGCATNCSVTPALSLTDGDYKWVVRGKNSVGDVGNWSVWTPFTVAGVAAPPPGRPSTIAPTGTIASSAPTFTWTAVTNGDQYELVVWTAANAQVHRAWYTSAAAGCATNCSVTPALTLADGDYKWVVRGKNSVGDVGLWSVWTPFTVAGSVVVPQPGRPSTIAPTGTIASSAPTFTWTAVTNGDQYELVVWTAANAQVHRTWYTAAAAGCATNCSVTPALTLADGDYKWVVRGKNSVGDVGLWSVWTNFTVLTPPPDTTPDAFTFTDLIDQATSALVTSNVITVTGINSPAAVAITVDGAGGTCKASVNGGGYTATPGNVSNSQTVQLQMTTSAANSAARTCAVTIGGVADGGSPWSVTTIAPPSPPGRPSTIAPTGTIASSAPAFTWTAVTNGDQYELVVWTAANAQVHRAWYTSAAAGCATNCSVTPALTLADGDYKWVVRGKNSVGDVGLWSVWTPFTVATAPLLDTAPDPFTFVDQTGVPLNTVISSNTLTVAGMNSVAPISISGDASCQYRVNGGAWSAVAGTINNGDTFTVQVTSSATPGAAVDCIVDIGGVTGAFSVITIL